MYLKASRATSEPDWLTPPKVIPDGLMNRIGMYGCSIIPVRLNNDTFGLSYEYESEDANKSSFESQEAFSNRKNNDGNMIPQFQQISKERSGNVYRKDQDSIERELLKPFVSLKDELRDYSVGNLPFFERPEMSDALRLSLL
jgi:hypothetical protein